MSIRWFKTFIAVTRYGSFAAAAQQIGLTQAAVSTQMGALEEKLHVKLFDRSARTATLNTAGRRLISRAEELVDVYDKVGDGLDEHQLGGVLALGAVHHTFSRLLPDALLRLQQSHPAIVVQACNGKSNDLMLKVERGELDAAIVSEAPFKLAQNLAWHTLVAEPLVLVTPATVKVSRLSDALATYPFISIGRASWTGQLTHAMFRRHRLKINEVMELDSLDAIAGMVARGFGISILPLSGYLRTLKNQVRIALLTEPQLARQIGLIHRQDQGRVALVSALRDSLVQTMRLDRPQRLQQLALNS